MKSPSASEYIPGLSRAFTFASVSLFRAIYDSGCHNDYIETANIIGNGCQNMSIYSICWRTPLPPYAADCPAVPAAVAGNGWMECSTMRVPSPLKSDAKAIR